MGEQAGHSSLEVALRPCPSGVRGGKTSLWVYWGPQTLLLEFPFFGLSLMGPLSISSYLWGNFHHLLLSLALFWKQVLVGERGLEIVE